jgi:pimeloyl-ACP methyl ester carboxylesterase
VTDAGKVAIERGVAGIIPYAAVGSGPPIVVCPGLWHTTGVDSDTLVRGSIGPVRDLRVGHRLIVLNRRAGLPTGMSISDIAAEYADVIRNHLGARVDVMGSSTGGSIAQQLAADHPDTVRRLVLVSTACRLGPVGRTSQARIAAALRQGHSGAAFAELAHELAPRGLRTLAGGVGRVAARRVLADAQTCADLAVTLEAEDGFDLATCADPIRAHTLIVAGGRDRFYPRELFDETAGLIADSTLALFPRRGHITVTSERRARAMIADFLRAA